MTGTSDLANAIINASGPNLTRTQHLEIQYYTHWDCKLSPFDDIFKLNYYSDIFFYQIIDDI